MRPDRSAGSICVAGTRSDGDAHVELVERRRGTNWIIPRLVELVEKHETAAVVCDTVGPAGSLVPEAEAAGLELTCTSARDLADACGVFFDAVEDGTLRHLGQPELQASIRGAVKRSLGDAWAFSRRNSTVDISPLVAATVALWGTQTVRDVEVFALAW